MRGEKKFHALRRTRRFATGKAPRADGHGGDSNRQVPGPAPAGWVELTLERLTATATVAWRLEQGSSGQISDVLCHIINQGVHATQRAAATRSHWTASVLGGFPQGCAGG